MTQTALLVIDLQRGAFDGVRIAPIAHADTLIGHAATLVAAARAAGVPIVFIQHGEDDGPFEAHTPHWELHEALVPQPGDVRVHKRQSSAFDGTGLAGQLESLGARNLILCGLQSEFCVSNTARSALGQGFAVILAQDAHGTWPESGEPAEAISARVNAQLQAAGARLASTQDLARTLAASAA